MLACGFGIEFVITCIKNKCYGNESKYNDKKETIQVE